MNMFAQKVVPQMLAANPAAKPASDAFVKTIASYGQSGAAPAAVPEPAGDPEDPATVGESRVVKKKTAAAPGFAAPGALGSGTIAGTSTASYGASKLGG